MLLFDPSKKELARICLLFMIIVQPWRKQKLGMGYLLGFTRIPMMIQKKSIKCRKTPHSQHPQQRLLSTYAGGARQTYNSDCSARTHVSLLNEVYSAEYTMSLLSHQMHMGDVDDRVVLALGFWGARSVTLGSQGAHAFWRA